MKYCANCGTQMPDEINTCQQCGYSSDSNTIKTPEIQPNITSQNTNQRSKKNKSVKLYIVIPIVIVVSIITSVIVSALFAKYTYNNYVISYSDEGCPEDKNGNHDWAPAKCTEPAQCYNCNAYRDDKLGQHKFYTDDDGFCDCTYCGIVYDDYINSKD